MAMNTPLNSILASTMSGIDANEYRSGTYGAFAFAKKDAKRLPLLADAILQKKAFSQVVKYPVLDNEAVTISNVRSLTGGTITGTSKYVDITFTTLSSKITMAKAQLEGDVYDDKSILSIKLDNMQNAWCQRLDELAVAALITSRSQVNLGGALPYPLTGEILQVPAAERNTFPLKLGELMMKNDFQYNDLSLICDPATLSVLNENSEFETYNSQNKAGRFRNIDIYFSNNVPAAGSLGAYLNKHRTLGFFSFIAPESNKPANPDGIQNPDGIFSKIALPKVGIFADVLTQYSRFDRSTYGVGNELAEKVTWTISVDFAYVSAYNSAPATRPSPIWQINVA